MNGRPDKWILNGKVPVPAEGLLPWAMWMESNRTKRHVGNTYLADNAIRISTVFLGLDHNFGPSGPPILFETLVFGGAHADMMHRYATWEEAEGGHAMMVAVATEALEKSDAVAGLLAGIVIAAIREKI